MTKSFTYVEDCTTEELSLDGIRNRAKAFNELFDRNGGYKTYEVQAIDALLERIDELEFQLRKYQGRSEALAMLHYGKPSNPDQKAALDEMVRLSEEAGLYEEPELK